MMPFRGIPHHVRTSPGPLRATRRFRPRLNKPLMSGVFRLAYLEDTACPLGSFNCGKRSINKFIRQGLLERVALGHCAARVCLDTTINAPAGVVTISPYCLDKGYWRVKDNLGMIPPDVLDKFDGKYPVPGWLIGQLGVDNKYKGQGLGEYLLMDALRLIKELSHHGCGSIAVVHADDDVKDFYRRYGFRQLPPDDCSVMFLPLRELEQF